MKISQKVASVKASTKSLRPVQEQVFRRALLDFLIEHAPEYLLARGTSASMEIARWADQWMEESNAEAHQWVDGKTAAGGSDK